MRGSSPGSRTRRGLLDAVVFSGGEPTAQAELAPAIDAVRALGFKIGLHTGGAYPRRLAEILPTVDWVGFDVKAPIADYAARHRHSPAAASPRSRASISFATRGVACEVRTTVHPALTPPAALLRLARELAARGVKRWVLQMFRATGCANEDARCLGVRTGASSIAALLARLSEHVPAIEVR